MTAVFVHPSGRPEADAERPIRKRKAGLVPPSPCGLRRTRSSQVLLARTAADLVAKKDPPEEASGGSQSSITQSTYAFIAPFTASAVIGSERTRAPQALKIALASAGATTVTAGSPTPVAFSPLAMTLMATSGT